MKRKRRDLCPSPFLDEGPKRTKVHAQRKFAQGSNVNSPVITPVKEFEKTDRSSLDLTPEPVELLPIRRPNTEDFLTFLCFRGTPLLPPNLNFFNTASIVDTNGQVHEIKSESPKNGPIDTSVITKGGTGTSDRPFIAFGVRKRADPIVISKQMEKKRRHALALQALRRKYQEQKMAKIRAVTISKLSEKPSNRATVRSNSISKIEKVQQTLVTKHPVQKNKVKVISSKHIKITAQPVRTLNSKMKPRMCLRSFRGRFVQQELPFRAVKKHKVPEKKMIIKKNIKKKEECKKTLVIETSSKNENSVVEKKVNKVVKQKDPKMNSQDLNFRVTRSTKVSLKSKIKGKQIIKRRILIPSTSTLVKPRVLRSQTSKTNSTIQSRTRRYLERKGSSIDKLPKTIYKKANLKVINKEVDLKKTVPVAKEITVLKKSEKASTSNCLKASDRVLRNDTTCNLHDTLESKLEKSKEIKTIELPKKDHTKTVQKTEPKLDNKKEKKDAEKHKNCESKKVLEKPKAMPTNEIKKELEKKTSEDKTKVTTTNENKKELEKKTTTKRSKSIDNKSTDTHKVKEKKEIKQPEVEISEEVHAKEQKCSQRPSRKTKEAAAIYMEILSHKLVNEKKVDDDTVSIDSFPELPNVKKTEQRENELKAKAGVSKNEKTNQIEKNVELITNCTFEKENTAQENKRKVNEEKEIDSKLDSEPKKKQIKSQPIRKNRIKNKCSIPEIEPDKSKVKVKTEKQKIDDKNITEIIDPIQVEIKEEKQSVTNLKVEVNDKIKKEVKTESFKEKDVSKQLSKNSTHVIKIDWGNKDAEEEAGKETIKKIITPNVKSIKSFNEVNVKQQEIEKGGDMEIIIYDKYEADIEDSTKEKLKDSNRKEMHLVTDKEKIPLLNSNQIIDSSDSDECLAKIPKVMKSNKNSKLQNTNQNTEIKPLKTVGDVQDENKFNLNEKVDCKSENKPYSQKGIETKDESKSTLKNQPKVVYDSDDECLANISKAKDFKTKTDLVSKRQTRHKHKHIESNDSEESFHIDVKIPRKKQLTRSRSSRHSVGSSKMKSDKFSNINNETDESTTSKNSSKTNKANIKKKTPIIKNQNKIEANFSESDEEPLSKLTLSKKEEDKSAEELKEDILRKQKAFIESPPPRSKVKKYLRHKETKEKESTTINSDNTEKDGALNIGKPKRECAKRPSNYLPMFSSSDDEEKFFHGFSSKNEKKNESIYSHSSLDFLSKDLGRRFGKGKVNMSNEQIEKWLKDSAMAGDESKKEDDMKFGQEIPTETSLTTNNIIDTEKLKNSLLEAQVTQVANEEATSSEKTLPSQEDTLKSLIYKSPGDRKPIFKKERSSTAPTVGAFSANNESSIYAFEEDIEEVVSTPFRRPARRPSSTATSKSEDELSKTEEQTKFGQFRKPILKTEIIKNEEQKQKIKESDLPTKPIQTQNTSKTNTRNILGKSVKKSSLEQLDDAKYKVPSSPSASSSSSAKLYKRQNKQKVKPTETCNPTKMTDFPCNGPGELVEAPTFYPTEKEFQDPLEYIEKIGVKAEQFGICRIVPPATFKPECKVSDDMRFTSYNQYVHKMLHRWGSNFKELMAIKKYLQTQNINLTQPPWIGGMEIDLPRLYQTVQSLGGLKEVIEKEKWSKVSDIMRIPKSAQDRVTKLDDIYCKYLLPYDTLSPDEREKLLDEVETEWAKRESKTLVKMQKTGIESENDSDSESDNEVEECITKGRNMALNAFYRIARNTMSMWFKNPEPTVQEIEQEFWKHVTLRQNHICVHSGSIDSGSWGYGFAVSKNSPFARHAWNLKVLTNNSGSVLRSLGPVMGVTVPTLHVGMVFSACCWYRDPHSLPWIEYLHTGGNKIWYGIPNSVGELFQKALIKLVPNYCRNQGIWLPSDTVMLPPSLLIESGVSLSRTVQEPGQFVVVFPKAFTSSISTGYVVSESVFFAPPSWLKTAQITFDLLRNSCEPSMFSLDKLYLNIISDQRTNVEVLKQMIPTVKMMSSNEKPKRENVRALGVTNFEILPPPETPNARRKKKSQEGGDYECEICRMNLFISMIVEQQEGAIYCLDHAIEQIKKKVILPENCKLLYTYTEDDLDNLVDKINASIGQKMQKKVFNKFSGMPTLLNKQN